LPQRKQLKADREAAVEGRGKSGGRRNNTAAARPVKRRC